MKVRDSHPYIPSLQRMSKTFLRTTLSQTEWKLVKECGEASNDPTLSRLRTRSVCTAENVSFFDPQKGAPVFLAKT